MSYAVGLIANHVPAKYPFEVYPVTQLYDVITYFVLQSHNAAQISGTVILHVILFILSYFYISNSRLECISFKNKIERAN